MSCETLWLLDIIYYLVLFFSIFWSFSKRLQTKWWTFWHKPRPSSKRANVIHQPCKIGSQGLCMSLFVFFPFQNTKSVSQMYFDVKCPSLRPLMPGPAKLVSFCTTKMDCSLGDKICSLLIQGLCISFSLSHTGPVWLIKAYISNNEVIVGSGFFEKRKNNSQYWMMLADAQFDKCSVRDGNKACSGDTGQHRVVTVNLMMAL